MMTAPRTLTMQDSIYVQNLTADADCYLGYVNGNWSTYAAVVGRFPGKPVISMAVSAGVNADGCDCEQFDLSEGQVPAFVKAQQARGVWRPVVYSDAANAPGLLGYLATAGIARASIRLLTAHYGAGNHICGPGSCRYPGVPPADGTQWTDAAPGANGSRIDQSVLLGDFFAPRPGSEPPVSTIISVTADGTETLSQIALANKTAPAGILRATAIADGLFAANLAAWIDGAIGDLVVPDGVVLRMP